MQTRSNPDRAWLEAEIEKRAPWYQRIDFPDYGVSTTDREDWLVQDPAWDNLFPGMDPKDAPRMRPAPKFLRFESHMPDVHGRTVLEVGCSCGFFSLEFAKRGAAFVTGLDIDEVNIERARFCAAVLGLNNVQFEAGDLGGYTKSHDIVWGSSLHEHFFFPFYYLVRLLCLAREKVILETHEYVKDDGANIARLDADFVLGAHAFHFSGSMFRSYLKLLFIDEKEIEERVFYNDMNVRRLLLIVDTRGFQKRRGTHPYLQTLKEVGV